MTQRVVLSDLTPRLEAAANAVKDAELEYRLALEQRDALVVQAVDEGMQQRRVAKAAGVSQPHVIRILARSEPDAVLPRL